MKISETIFLLAVGLLLAYPISDVFAAPTIPPNLKIFVADSGVNSGAGGLYAVDVTTPPNNVQQTEIRPNGNNVPRPTDVAFNSTDPNNPNLIVISDRGTKIIRISDPLGSPTSTTITSVPGYGLNGVDIDRDGNIIATNFGDSLDPTPRLMKVTSTGVVSTISSGNHFIFPWDVAIDTDGNYVVLDLYAGIIIVDKTTGAPTLILNDPTFIFYHALSIDVTSTGRILITNSDSPASVMQVDRVTGLVTPFYSDTRFVNPTGITLFGGDVYVADADAHVDDPAIFGFAQTDPSNSALFYETNNLEVTGDIDTGIVRTPVNAQVTLIKTGPATIAGDIGTQFVYKINATNLGPDISKQMVILDKLPKNGQGNPLDIQLISNTITLDGAAPPPTAKCTFGNNQVQCDGFGNIPAGGHVNVTLSVNLSQPLSSSITNEASVTSESNSFTSKFTTSVSLGQPDLKIEYTSVTSPVIAGENVMYQIKVSNKAGSSNAQNVIVTYNLPAYLQFVSATLPSNLPACAVPSTSTCNLGTITNGQSKTFTLTAKVTPNTLNPLTPPQYSSTVSSDATDSNPNDNSADSLPFTLNTKADLSVTITPTPLSIVNAGTVQQYLITILNTGPSDAQNVQLTSILTPPPSLGPLTFTGPCTSLACNLGTLAPSSPVIVTVQGQVNPSAVADILFNSNVISSTFDPNTSNNAASKTNKINHPPKIAPIPPKTTDELVLLQFNVIATDDFDTVPDTLTYSLVADVNPVPSGASINSTTGVFTWTPTEAQGPGVFSFNVRVSDGLSETLAPIVITVKEVNLPPVLQPIPNKVTFQLIPLGFTAIATDPDIPPNTLTFSLSGQPAGSSINPTTGVFNWTPTLAQGPAIFTFDVVVKDNGVPQLEDRKSVSIEVKKSLREFKKLVGDNTNGLKVTFSPLEKYTIKEIDKAVEHIKKSTEQKLWTDEIHLDAKHGRKVFHEEEYAVKSLMKSEKEADDKCKGVTSMELEYSGDVDPVKIIITQKKNNPATYDGILDGDSVIVQPLSGKDKLESTVNIKIISGSTIIQETDIETSCSKPIDEGDQYGLLEITELDTIPGNGKSKTTVPSGYDSAVQGIINDFITIDRNLAKIALDQASTFAGNPKVDKEITKANEELLKAEQSVINREFDKAIHHFEKTWKYAQDAIKHGS